MQLIIFNNSSFLLFLAQFLSLSLSHTHMHSCIKSGSIEQCPLALLLLGVEVDARGLKKNQKLNIIMKRNQIL